MEERVPAVLSVELAFDARAESTDDVATGRKGLRMAVDVAIALAKIGETWLMTCEAGYAGLAGMIVAIASSAGTGGEASSARAWRSELLISDGKIWPADS